MSRYARRAPSAYQPIASSMSSTFIADHDASFSVESMDETTPYFYSRWANPTVAQLASCTESANGAAPTRRLERVVAEQPIEALRSDIASVRGTPFWAYAITTLPRGAGPDPDRRGFLRYTLEASLWMVFYEMLTHVRTIQRLKLHQGLSPAQDLPRVGYLRLPEYWGQTNQNGPGMQRFDVD